MGVILEGVTAPGSTFEDEVEVSRVRFAAEDGEFAVVEADRDGDELILVGPVAHLEAGERVAIAGTWQENARFGLQVRVRSAQPLQPAGDAALRAYLERVRGIGASRARLLLERHGERVLDVIDADPRRAFKDAGLGARQAARAAGSWDALRSVRSLHLLLGPHGLAWLVPRLDKHYGPRAHRVVRESPYELTSVFGVGFATADTIARAAGVPPDSPQRAVAGLVHVLSEAERDGSTCLPAGEAVERTRRLLGRDLDAVTLVRDAATADAVTLEDGFLYRPATAALERELATRVHRLVAAAPARTLAAGPDVAVAADGLGPAEAPGAGAAADRVPTAATTTLEPQPQQREAVVNAFAHRLSLVTGGPGTGKTATIRLVCAAAHAADADVTLVAPTGRAARRVAESTNLEATTVHALLGWIPGEGPQRDEHAPLPGDVLVVDETSMANLELLVALLRAVGPRMHVVLVGDQDQLAPVGAGKPFAELAGSGLVPAVQLTHVFRQAAGSMIVRGAHEVRQGRPPSFVADDGLERDLFLVERAAPADALAEIVTLVSERLPRFYGVSTLEDIQVFAPVYRGPLGIDAINAALQAALNPHGEPVLGGRLRIGDKLMLSGRNLHDLGLMNGTVLRLEAVMDDTIAVTADGLEVELPADEAGGLRLAYACSVHKGQGIELPVGIVVAHPAAGAAFLRREMLYTAMTRARRATVIVGQSRTVADAAARADTARRTSRLVDRLATSHD